MKLDHIVILLGDIKNTLPFYESLLPLIGFEKQRSEVFSNAQGIFVDLKQASDDQHEYRRHAPGLNHFGVVAPDKETLLSVKNAMESEGWQVPDIQTFDEGEAIFFKDPEGMRVEVAYYYSN